MRYNFFLASKKTTLALLAGCSVALEETGAWVISVCSPRDCLLILINQPYANSNAITMWVETKCKMARSKGRTC